MGEELEAMQTKEREESAKERTRVNEAEPRAEALASRLRALGIEL